MSFEANLWGLLASGAVFLAFWSLLSIVAYKLISGR